FYSSLCAPHSPVFLSCTLRVPPCPTLFPYTTLFRSARHRRRQLPGNPPLPAPPAAVHAGRDHLRPAGYVRCDSLLGFPCAGQRQDRKSTRLNSSHVKISYAVFCLKKQSDYVRPWVLR